MHLLALRIPAPALLVGLVFPASPVNGQYAIPVGGQLTPFSVGMPSHELNVRGAEATHTLDGHRRRAPDSSGTLSRASVADPWAGSATVAMITAVGIIAPIADAASLPYHDVYVALAIGCGSKPGMWMNDSGFWVIARMTGMTETETLKTASVMVAIEGTVGLLVTMALAASWPLT